MLRRFLLPFFISLTLGGVSALAELSPAPQVNNACTPVVSACVSAGFIEPTKPAKGSGREAFKAYFQQKKMLREEGKSARANCLRPILKGEAVSGVTVDASWNLAACKNEIRAKREARRARREARRAKDQQESQSN